MSANLISDGANTTHSSLGPLVSEHGAGLERQLRVAACGVLTVLLVAGAAWAAVSSIPGKVWIALALAVLTLLPAAGLVVLIKRSALSVLRDILASDLPKGKARDSSVGRCVYYAINAVTRLTKKDVRDKPVEEMDIEMTRQKVLDLIKNSK